MATHTVTVGQFRVFVEAKGYKTDAERDGKGGFGYRARTRNFDGPRPAYSWKRVGWKQTDRHSVVNVSWNDAVAYCKWLSMYEGKSYRLPTEAEWEFACRAGTSTPYSFGGKAGAKYHANMADKSLKKKLDPKAYKDFQFAGWDDKYPFTAPVGSFRPNGWGLYDTHGNVWQRCRDCYDAKFYKAEEAEDPECTVGDRRVMRGGSWLGDPTGCRAAGRFGCAPTGRVGHVGFRVVCVP
jgi:formylglycine-generating enzyme required for sulfatase activity